MASPAQLVEVVSRATGVPQRTIIDIDRRMVAGNLRSKGGRGLNVVQVTAFDAACLITAMLASPQANTSAEAVNRYAVTSPEEALSSQKLFSSTQLSDLARLSGRHSFVEGLAALIASAAKGDLARMIERSADAPPPHLEIFAFTRATRGRIRLSGLPNRMTATVEYIGKCHGAQPARRKMDSCIASPLSEREVGDLEQSRRVTGATIFPVAQLLAEGSDD